MTTSLLQATASGLALWPGLLLVVAGLAKAADSARGDVGDTVVARMIPGRRPLRAVWSLAAAAELTVGVLILAGLAVPWSEVAAALLLGSATLVSVWGLRHTPDAGCGCFGGRASTRLSARTVLRAGLLAGLAAVAAAGTASWTSVFGHPAAVAVMVGAGAAVAWLSPELAKFRDRAADDFADASDQARRIRDAACVRRIPVEWSVARLHRSELWRRARPYVSGETPTEHWDEGCWRLLLYPAAYHGESVTAVFAIRLGVQHGRNSVTFVDEAERRVLGRLEAGRSSA